MLAGAAQSYLIFLFKDLAEVLVCLIGKPVEHPLSPGQKSLRKKLRIIIDKIVCRTNEILRFC